MSYSSEVLADAPIGWWRQGDSSGTTMTDSSGNGRNGTYTNSPTLATPGLLVGDPSTAVLYASASSQNAGVPDDGSTDSLTAITLEAWIKPTTVSGVQQIASRDGTGGRCWQFRMNAGKIELIKIAGGAVTAASSTTLIAGNVYHVVATYDGSNLRVYINGAQDGTTPAASGTMGSSSLEAVQIAFDRSSVNNTQTGYFNGVIDEVAVYDHALSATRIAAHYAAGRTLFLDDTTTATEALTAHLTKAIADSTTLSDSLSSDLQSGGSSLTHDVDDTTTSTDALTKALTKALDDTTTSTEALDKSTSHPVADSTTSTDGLTTAAGKAAADSTTSSDNLSVHLTRAIADTTTPSDTLDGTGTLSHGVDDTTTSTDALGKHLTVHLADSTTSNDQLGAALHAHLGDTVALTDDLTRALAKRIADQVATSDQLTATRGLVLLLDDTTTSNDLVRTGPVAPTPGERTRLVTAELRVHLVPLEDRTRLITAENRTKEAR